MRRTPVAILLLVLPSLALSAQYALDVEAIVGFSGVFRAGTWTPVHVTIQNLGQDVRGDLSLEIERGDRFGPQRYSIVVSRPVELVSGSSKAFSFVVPLDTTVYPLTIRLTDGDEIAHEERYDLLGKSVPSQLALVLARRPNLDFLLPLYNNRDTRVLDVVYSLPNYLPTAWQGYEAIDIMVIHDARLQELSREQVDAIASWVASGGRLVVSGGAHFGPADAETLRPLGDLTTTGITTTTVEETGFLELGLPLDPEERRRQVVATTFSDYGTSMTVIPRGRGDIVVLPVDYANLVRIAPLSSVALWNALLSRRASDDAVSTEVRRRVFEVDVLSNQLGLPLYDFPSRLLVLGLALSYLVGLGALLFWLSRGGGALRTWLGAPAIAGITLAVSLAGHFALTVSLQPDEALALSVERAELVEEGGYALVTRDTALFSRGGDEYRVRYDGRPLLIPIQERDHWIVSDEGGTTQRLAIERWGHENNLAFQIVPLAVRFRLTPGASYAELTLHNESDRTLRSAVMLRNGFPEELGSLLPGETAEHVTGGPPSGEFQDIEWDRYVPADALVENRGRLLGDIARSQRFEGEDAPEIIVVAWTDRPLMPATVTPEFERTVDLHLLTIPIEMRRSEP